MAKDRREASDDDADRPWIRLGGVGIELAAAVGGFALVGHLFDRARGTHPKGLLIGAVLGIIGGFYNLIKASLAASREARRDDREKAAGNDRGSDPET